MNYSNRILGKDIEDLIFQDIATYFYNIQQESNVAEYKSYNPKGEIDNKLTGIYKSVCALLNSEGGIVIWGAPEGKRVEGRKEKEFIGDLTPINRIIEKDYLINKISNNIIPLPNSIKANIIEHEDSCIVVLEIEKSAYAPHQTNDIYYMRLDGQSVPAPHNYIEALFKQIKYPELGGYISFVKIQNNGSQYYLSMQVIIMNHSPIINEENIFFSLTSSIGSVRGSGNASIENNGLTLHHKNFINLLHYGLVNSYDVAVLYNHDELLQNNFESSLILMFGGKNIMDP